MDPNLQTVLGFAVVGFLAQIVDGCLGMAYGVLSNTLMLALGKPPALASASLKVAETFTTAVSGVSHWKFGNVDWKLVGKLAVPGVLGGVLGAYILTNIDGNLLKPFVALYLIAMGFRVLWKAFKPTTKVTRTYIAPLGLVGGFFDAIGGGGWGPIVTSTLVANGHNPRQSIGSVNTSEFFVTFAQAVTFITTIIFTGKKLIDWRISLGLLLGGVIAAPLAAWLCKKIPMRALMIAVGILIMATSLRTLILSYSSGITALQNAWAWVTGLF
jgi:uncharacterized protein